MHSLFDNYRPISLLSSLPKVFERIIHSQILEYCTENKLITEYQYGFHPRHSTEHAVLHLYNCLLND